MQQLCKYKRNEYKQIMTKCEDYPPIIHCIRSDLLFNNYCEKSMLSSGLQKCPVSVKLPSINNVHTPIQ